MHDQASTNGVAMQTIKVVFPLIVDIGCYSYTLDLVGDKFDLPVLDDFVRLWINLFSGSICFPIVLVCKWNGELEQECQ